MIDYTYTILIPLIPLLMFIFLGLTGHKFKAPTQGILGTLGLLVSTLLSYYTAYQYFFNSIKVDGAYQKIIGFHTLWLKFTDTLYIDLGVILDPISVMMLIVITTVSLMVHLYSIGYMKGDKGFSHFFAFLSLFSFSMLGLVIATNIFQMYIFWELVGVSSYLLIGFYYEKQSAVAAAKKAFIVTRFADLGFLIGILILSFNTGTFDFQLLTNPHGAAILKGGSIAFMGLSTMTWAMILIFMGGAGKSAMFPLHIWLPDAMEGPTPVSALIHAATMVVAGVYLVARLFSDFCYLCSFRSGSCSMGWRIYIALCSGYCLYSNRHQTGTRFFHHVANRLYDACSGCFGLWRRTWIRLYGFYVPFVYSRIFQSITLPWRRSHYSCRAQQQHDRYGWTA